MKYRIALVVVVFAWSSWAGEAQNLKPGWWLAKNFRVVTCEFLERGHRQSDLSPAEILGNDYLRRARAAGAEGVFFHSLCRLSGLPEKTQLEITTAIKQRFKEIDNR